MSTKDSTTVRKKDLGYYDINATSIAEVKVIRASYSGIAETIGLTLDDTPPTGKTVIASGRNQALLVGCFPVVIVYSVGAGKYQSAKVLVAPAKADTAIAELRGKTYRGKRISEVRPVRRRVFTV